MTGGPNKGGKSLYSLDPDGYIVEFHQRPAAAASWPTSADPPGEPATARRAVPADAPDPCLRGAGSGALQGGRDPGDRAQLRRPGGDRRRRGGRHAGGRLPRRAPPLARPSHRGRRRSPADDGRDVRQADGLLQGARRLDAHRRPVAGHPRLQRDRRRRDPARVRRRADGAAARVGPGVRRVLRRRCGGAGRGARRDEPRGDLEAPGGLRVREQPVRPLCWLADVARGGGSRRPRGRLRDAGEVVDGNDLLAVEDAVARALAAARAARARRSSR